MIYLLLGTVLAMGGFSVWLYRVGRKAQTADEFKATVHDTLTAKKIRDSVSGSGALDELRKRFHR